MSYRFPLCFLIAAAALLPMKSSSATDAVETNTLPAPAATLTVPVSSPLATNAGPASQSPTAPGTPTATTNAPQPTAMQTPEELPVQEAQGTERSSYSSIRVDGPYIAMTFDDGPHPTLTPRLLDMLKERHIHVTFFVLGQCVKEHPEIVQRALAEGHEIGNHSWDHPPLNKLAEGGLHHQLADTSTLLKETTGKAPTLMRPPYGATNPRLSRAIEKEYGMKVILWSVDPFDWKRPGPQVVEARILAGAKPGAIILSHDIHPGTIQAMPATLDALLAKGYKFVTVSELMALESKKPLPATSAAPASSPSKKKKS